MKKKIIIVVSVLVVIIIGIITFLLLNKKEKVKKPVEKFDDVIMYTITLDINPSIKIELNKDKKVINVTALNDDAKEVINEDFKEKTFEEEIELLSINLNNKHLLEDATIIVTIENMDETEVKDILNKSFETKSATYDLLVPQVTESAKEIASKYNISQGKAAYLESIINENPKLNIEDIASSSVKEIDDKINTIKEEEKNNKQNNSASSQSNVKPSVGRPTNAQDKSGAWCTYNSNKAFNDTFNYPETIAINRVYEIGENQVRSIDTSYINNSGAEPIDDIRGSYCRLFKYHANTDLKKYYVYIDSVTGSIVDTKVEDIPKPKITREEAIQIGLNYFSNVDTSNCRVAPQVEYSEAYQGRMSYGFFMECNNVQYSARIDGITGEVFGVF